MSDKTHNGNYDPSPVPRWLQRIGFWRVADNPIFQMESRNFKKSRGRRFIWGMILGLIITSVCFIMFIKFTDYSKGEIDGYFIGFMELTLSVGILIILLRGLIETLIIGPIRLQGEIESNRMNFLKPVPMEDREIFNAHASFNLYKAIRSNDWMLGFLLSSIVLGSILGYPLIDETMSVTISLASILTSIVILLAGIFLYIAIRSRNLTFGYLMAACIVISLPVFHVTEDYGIIYSLMYILGIMAGFLLGNIIILALIFKYIYLSSLTGTMYQFRFSPPYATILAFIHVVVIWVLSAVLPFMLWITFGFAYYYTDPSDWIWLLFLMGPVQFGLFASFVWLTRLLGVKMFGGFRRAM